MSKIFYSSILCMLVGCGGGYYPPTPPSPSSPTAQQFLDAHNKIRVQNGLTPLKLSDKLVKAAQLHSQDQADHRSMSHTGSDGSSPYDRMERQGYSFSLAGENVAWNYPDLQAVMDGWMKSPGHRANILRSGFTEMGAAEVNKYWTVDFGTPGRLVVKEVNPELFPGGVQPNVSKEEKHQRKLQE